MLVPIQRFAWYSGGETDDDDPKKFMADLGLLDVTRVSVPVISTTAESFVEALEDTPQIAIY